MAIVMPTLRPIAMDHQRGQALVEAVLALAVSILLGAGIIVLGRLQWQGLEATHTGRVAVFRYAHGDITPPPPGVQRLRASHAAPFLGPGGARTIALRRAWDVEDNGIVTAYAQTDFSPTDFAAAAYSFFNGAAGQRYTIRRHISLLAQAGNAVSDQHAQQRIHASNAAWGDAAQLSIRAGRRARADLHSIDRAWGRAAPDFDWLMPWSDLVIANRLSSHRKVRGETP